MFLMYLACTLVNPYMYVGPGSQAFPCPWGVPPPLLWLGGLLPVGLWKALDRLRLSGSGFIFLCFFFFNFFIIFFIFFIFFSFFLSFFPPLLRLRCSSTFEGSAGSDPELPLLLLEELELLELEVDLAEISVN